MKYLRISLLVLTALAMTSWSSFITLTADAAVSQNQASALERGYRTGYSDGYTSGTRDVTDQAAREYQSKADYQSADRSYNEAWGTIEEYRDGYRQGFESGYAAGYDRRPFDSSIPNGLTSRAAVDSTPNAPDTTSPDNSNNPPQDNSNNSAQTPTNSAPVNNPLYIPRNAVLLVELESSLSTDVSQRGDRFQARVIDPQEFSGAIVEGTVTLVKRAGKVKGSSEIQLAFESIRMPDGRSTTIKADVIELIDMGNRSGGTVDAEGGVKGRDSTKDDVSKVGASTGIGAIIGLVIGGGKGAAIGAAIGAGVGTGSVLSSRGKDVRLDRGQQLKIRTATESRIQ